MPRNWGSRLCPHLHNFNNLDILKWHMSSPSQQNTRNPVPRSAETATGPADIVLQVDLSAALPQSAQGKPTKEVPVMRLDDVAAGLEARGLRPHGCGNMLVGFPTRCEVPQSRASGPRLAVIDVDASRACKERLVLRNLRRLMQNCAVPFDARFNLDTTGVNTTGLWYIDSVSDLRKRLGMDGAQLLVLKGKDKRLWGHYTYDLEEKHMLKEDRRLVDYVRAELKLRMDQKIGFAYEIAIDRRIASSLEKGGLGIKRKEAAMELHRAMILEARRSGITHMVSYVWEKPYANTAMKSHSNFGWQEVANAKIECEGHHPITGLSCTMIGQVVVLDVNSKLQDKLLDTPISSRFEFKDLDPS